MKTFKIIYIDVINTTMSKFERLIIILFIENNCECDNLCNDACNIKKILITNEKKMQNEIVDIFFDNRTFDVVENYRTINLNDLKNRK